MATLPVKSITGIELDEQQIGLAEKRRAELDLKIQPRFILGDDPAKIAMPDRSVDVILVFDVMEHILEYRSVIAEWRRVLRPGGQIFIWWMPWFHPFGHHIRTLVPLPWAHVFFSEKTLVRTCAKMFDSPGYKPRHWDIDENGRKKPNKWKAMKELPTVNRLTIKEFERVCSEVGLVFEKRRFVGFRKGKDAGMNLLARLPLCREFFCSYVTYVLCNKSGHAR